MKINKFLTPIFLIILFLASCSSTTPDIFTQTPLDTEVMGMGENIKAWRDHRGIFYYLNNNGNKTDEPVYLDQKTCTPAPTRRGGNLIIRLFDLAARNTQNEKRAIEMQCNARKQWEQGNRYGSRNYYRR